MATIRVTDAEVKEILDTHETNFTAFILAASVIVDSQLATPAIITNSEQLKEIERWLAAHFFTIKGKWKKSIKTGESEATYFGKADLGLDATSYGQQVKLLDTSGTLVESSTITRTASLITIEAISYASAT